MAPGQRRGVGNVFVADIHAVSSGLLDGFLHVEGIPVHDGIEGKAEGPELFFLPLLERASDFTAFAVMNGNWRRCPTLGSGSVRM